MQADADYLVFEVPQGLDPDALVADLANSAVVPRLRSGALGTTITVGLDALGGTSAVVQLLVARGELRDFARRLIRRSARERRDAPVTLTVRLETHDRSIAIDAVDPEGEFVAAVAVLLAVSAGPNADAADDQHATIV